MSEHNTYNLLYDINVVSHIITTCNNACHNIHCHNGNENRRFMRHKFDVLYNIHISYKPNILSTS